MPTCHITWQLSLSDSSARPSKTDVSFSTCTYLLNPVYEIKAHWTNYLIKWAIFKKLALLIFFHDGSVVLLLELNNHTMIFDKVLGTSLHMSSMLMMFSIDCSLWMLEVLKPIFLLPKRSSYSKPHITWTVLQPYCSQSRTILGFITMEIQAINHVLYTIQAKTC